MVDEPKGEIGVHWFFETPEVQKIEEKIIDITIPRRILSAPKINKKALKLATLMSNFDFEVEINSCGLKKTPDFGLIATPSTKDSNRTHFFPEQP